MQQLDADTSTPVGPIAAAAERQPATGRVPYDMRLLRSFLVLADELHFGRAAQRLAFARPALSQQISRLETQVGLALFVRNSRSVELTAAGTAFRRHARASVEAAQDASAAVRAAERACSGALPLVIPGSALAHAKPLLRLFAAAQPDVQLEISANSHPGAVEALRHHNADAAVLCSGDEPPTGYEATSVLISSPGLGVAVSTSHRFATLDGVSVDCLRDERLTMFPRAAAPELHDRVLACLGGVEHFGAVKYPQTIGPDTHQEIMFSLGEGSIAISSPWTADHRKPDGVVFVPLHPPLPLSLWLVWEHPATPPTLALADLARRLHSASSPLSLVSA